MFIMRWLSLGFALVGGVFASQLPEFSQQYRQRVGGALDEINRMLAEFDLDAKANNLTRMQGIEKLRSSADPFVAQRGNRVAADDVRAARLNLQQKNFEGAGSFARMFVMAKDYDAGIAARAWQDFKPAVPLSMEGAISAAAGFFAGFGLWHLLGWPVRNRQRRFEGFKQKGATP